MHILHNVALASHAGNGAHGNPCTLSHKLKWAPTILTHCTKLLPLLCAAHGKAVPVGASRAEGAAAGAAAPPTQPCGRHAAIPGHGLEQRPEQVLNPRIYEPADLLQGTCLVRCFLRHMLDSSTVYMSVTPLPALDSQSGGFLPGSMTGSF